MMRERVDSSVMAAIGYDPDAQVMEVEFVSGAVYRYAPVCGALYARFRTASSLGQFFDANIRDVVPFTRLV
jgi:hypothetical protein